MEPIGAWTSGRRERRRFTLAWVAFFLACLIPLITTQSVGHATSGGDPYSVPNVVDTNPDPNIVETTLSAQAANVDIGNGVTAHALTFNGSIPGPTFHLKVGDTVIVHFENHIDKPTGVHWHGIEVPNSMDGTPLTKNTVQPGGTFLYKFKVTRPGTFWYHPHHHSSTNQVFKGMYGMIVVTDPNDAQLQAAGTLPSAAQTKQIVLSDTTVCKTPGSNDSPTYTIAGAPHVSGAALVAQAAPTAKDICETAPIDEEGAARGAFAAGDVPNIQRADAARTNEGQTVLTNGKNVGPRSGGPVGQNAGVPNANPPGVSTLDVQKGQGLRLQILNAATVRYMRLRLTDAGGNTINLFRVGGEGGLLNAAVQEGGTPGGGFDTKYTPGETLIPGGSRADVVAPINTGGAATVNVGDILTLWTEDYQRVGGGGYSNIPTVPVMHLKVTGTVAPAYTIANGTPLRSATGNPVENLGALPTGTLLSPGGFGKLGMASQNISLTATMNVAAGIGSTNADGVKGLHDVGGDYMDAPHMGSSRYAKEGDTLQLTVQNTTTANHPFHLHGFSIQPIKLVSGGLTNNFAPEFRDNVDVPGGATLTFRVRLDPRPQPDGTTPGGDVGRWVFHCHIFFHAVQGMISELVVTNPSGNERPDVSVNGAGVTVGQGQTAQMQGTFNDPDGDPVTLTSSVGTITKTGGRGFTWSYPTGTDTSKVVYITATDTNGLRGQIPFQLTINNTGSPTLKVPGAQSVPSGDPLSFNVSATDPDPADPIRLSASGLPTGLKFKDNGNRTGSVSGKTTAKPGVYTATFSAADAQHPPVTGTVKITVTPLAVVLDRPEVMIKNAITVGCRFYSVSLQTCTAQVLSGNVRGVPAAAANPQVGKASVKLKRRGKRTANVRVVLKKSFRRRIPGSIGGIAITVKLTATKFGSRAKTVVSKTTTVVAPRVVATPSFATFPRNSSTLNTRAKTYLTSLAGLAGKTKRITCTGYPDTRGNATLGKKRASAACTAIRNAGLRTKYSTSGSSRARSRQLSITILR